MTLTKIKINDINFVLAPKETIEPARSKYVVLRTVGPWRLRNEHQLSRLGVDMVERLSNDCLLCWYDAEDLKELEKCDFVAKAMYYPLAVKIAPALLGLKSGIDGADIKKVRERLSKLDTDWPNLDDPVDISVRLHLNKTPKELVDAVVTAADSTAFERRAGQSNERRLREGRPESDSLRVGYRAIYLKAAPLRFKRIAELDEVRAIEGVYPAVLMNNVATRIMRVPTKNPPVAHQGDGEIIAIADTGFDRGSATRVPSDFRNRVLRLYPLGRRADDQAAESDPKLLRGCADDPHGHGTHVAGSALGYDRGLGIQGTAPKARLIMQSIYYNRYWPIGGLKADLGNWLFGPAYEDGARTHSNSWGSGNSLELGAYDKWALEIDGFVWRNRDLIICVAAGNEGNDCDGNGRVNGNTITPPATARNCITVGASESCRPKKQLTWGDPPFHERFPARPLKNDRIANNSQGMAAFSSRGPTNDRRIKPDLIAPGTLILSVRSSVTQAERQGLEHGGSYMYDSGTSMSTPLVAGCAASVRSCLRSDFGIANPSAALVKAALINGARRIRGQFAGRMNDAGGSIPNCDQGFGLVDLRAVVDPSSQGARLLLFDEDEELSSEGEHIRKIHVPRQAQLLQVTLVWTDAPGAVLQNDLDLIVSAGGRERHGNMRGGSTQFDDTNNVEQVIWPKPPSGRAMVKVVARKLRAPQNYALVVRVRRQA